jgi:hypothetical protein
MLLNRGPDLLQIAVQENAPEEQDPAQDKQPYLDTSQRPACAFDAFGQPFLV